MTLTVLILTYNEELHIERAIKSVSDFADEVLVVDSFSNDKTRELAAALGARVLTNPWKNYATQFNWGLSNVSSKTSWVMRLDADEVVDQALAKEISSCLPSALSDINGIYVRRRMSFMGKPIRWGGVFPISVIRLFRPSFGKCEDRWMDEHIIVSGNVMHFSGEILDDNLKSISWWTQKHNSYASREVVDILNQELKFMPSETIASLEGGQAGFKRWVKEHIYSRLPGGLRALLYFIYRFWVRLGFLDGRRGTIFHVLQGYWYRYLVDSKLYEVRRHMKDTGDLPVDAIKKVLGIDVSREGE